MNARARLEADLLAIVTGLAASWLAFSVVAWLYGESPREMLGLLFEGTLGSPYGFGQALFKATPILFSGISVHLALRAGLFNIGAEGQMTVASLAVGAVGASLAPSVSPVVAIPLLVACAALAGAAWALVPALLRAKLGAHEVISTIMMNRVADAFVALLLGLGLAQKGSVRTPDLPRGATLPKLDALFHALHGSASNMAIFLGIALLLAATAAWPRTRIGREQWLAGQNPVACAAEKIPVARRVAQALVVSGAVAGLASTSTVMGYKGYYEQGLGAGAGFTGLAVALLGRGRAAGILFAALLFGLLDQGGLALNAHLPREAMQIVQAVTIVAVALSDARVRAWILRLGAFVSKEPRGAVEKRS